MKQVVFIAIIGVILFFSCKTYTPQQVINHDDPNGMIKSDTVSISSSETDYEIIIIEPGFNAWLNGIARPRGYYSQSFLEQRNDILVQNWNLRHFQPGQYDANLYVMSIDYDRRTDYGYEVNYLLYNYFIYFQLHYNQKLSSFIPRI